MANPIAEFGVGNTVTDGATQTFDCSTGSHFQWTLGANRTMSTPTNAINGQTIWLAVVQDSTGSRTVTWPSNWTWPGGTAPTLTTTAAKLDLFFAKYDGINSKWRANTVGLNYTA